MKKYKFSLKDECMKELPSMEKPSFSALEMLSPVVNKNVKISAYKKHISLLQSIPVPKEFLNQFEDEKIYNEDEFEIKKDCHDDSTPPFSSFCSYCSRSKGCDAPLIAVPKQKSEAELWQEAAMILFKKHNPNISFDSEIGRMLYHRSFIKDMQELQKHYTITRK